MMWLYMRGIYIEVWGLVSDVVIHERYIYRGMGLSE